jgi:hypothetical protein
VCRKNHVAGFGSDLVPAGGNVRYVAPEFGGEIQAQGYALELVLIDSLSCWPAGCFVGEPSGKWFDAA